MASVDENKKEKIDTEPDPLQGLRAELDALDNQLVITLAKRLQQCDLIARVKREHGIPMMQPHRIDYVRERCAALGRAHDVSPDFIVDIYKLIIAETCRREDLIIDSAPEAGAGS